MWAICAIFRSLQEITKEIAVIENCKIAGWQKQEWALTFIVKFRVYGR